jgi:SlyX protein
MNSEALEQIQIRITFLERANTELSDVVYRQAQQIQALTAAIKDVSERLRATQSATGEGTPEEERPPHY